MTRWWETMLDLFRRAPESPTDPTAPADTSDAKDARLQALWDHQQHILGTLAGAVDPHTGQEIRRLMAESEQREVEARLRRLESQSWRGD